MNVDGRTIARDILKQVRAEVAQLGRVPVVRAVALEPSAATRSYLGVKARRAKDAGMTLDVAELPAGSTEEDLIAAVQAPGADAVIVQLPLPSYIDTKKVLDAIPENLDADVLGGAAQENGTLLPPVVGAVAEILKVHQVEVSGKKAVVVGSGGLVGRPVAAWLMKEGAEVVVVTRETGEEEFTSALRAANLIVSGAGAAGIIRPEHLTEGVVLIDAGTSESDGALAGDADPACASVASVFTPVPGGVGPIAVACLFRNVSLMLPN